MRDLGPDARRTESEAKTRRKRIDPKLSAQGWSVLEFDPSVAMSQRSKQAAAEFPTENGPADYESRLAAATAQVERTTQAIVAKAFRGELQTTMTRDTNADSQSFDQ